MLKCKTKTMSKPTSLSELLTNYPSLSDLIQYIPTGAYSLQELYEFNPFERESDEYTTQGKMISEAQAVSVEPPIVELDEMYKASLIVKAQLQLLVRLIRNKVVSSF
jgi:hypothetical protein